MAILHILNGSAVLNTFKDSGLVGDVAILQELFCHGPTQIFIYTGKNVSPAHGGVVFLKRDVYPECLFVQNW